MFYEATAGLCNQLFSLLFKLCHAESSGGGVVFIGSFMTQIRESHTQPLRTILNVDATNARFRDAGKHVVVADFHSYSLRVLHVVKNGHQVLPQNTHGDARNFIMALPDTDTASTSTVTFEVDGHKITYTNEGSTITLAPNRALFNIQPYPKNELFCEFAKLLVFHETIVAPPTRFMRSVQSPVQLMHLRTETDAIAHWSVQTGLSPPNFKHGVEDAYLKALDQYGTPSLPLVVLTGDADSRVLHEARAQGYHIILPPKFSGRRELAALGDLVCAETCTGVAFNVGVVESSFSVLLSVRVAPHLLAVKGVSYTIQMLNLDKPLIIQT